MLNRKDDIPYCGVRPEVISKAKPKLNPVALKHHWEWIRDRYDIHLKKDVDKLPAPWTDNPVLLHHKFTNVRREHDRQSKYLIEGICLNDRLSIEDKVWNIILFRMFNKYDIFNLLGGPWTMEEVKNWDLEDIRKKMMQADLDAGGDAKFFTNAFNTGGLKQCLAFPELVDAVSHDHKAQRSGGMLVTLVHTNGQEEELDYKVAKKIAEDNPVSTHIKGWERYMPMRIIRSHKWRVSNLTEYAHRLCDAHDQKHVYHILQELTGFSRFLAYQVFVDFTYCPEYKFSENEFTVSGPGCSRGLEHLFDDTDGMNDEECLFWLRDNQMTVYGPLGYEPDTFWRDLDPVDRCMNVMSLENTFCELSKYIRCVDALANGEQMRTKVKYDGVNGTGDLAYQKAKKSKTKKLF